MNLVVRNILIKKFKLLCFCTVLLNKCSLNGQEIPQEFFLYNDYKIKIDCGQHWDSHSIFGPVSVPSVSISVLIIEHISESLNFCITYKTCVALGLL